MAKPTEVPGLSRKTPLAVAGPLLVRARLADVSRYVGTLQRDGEPDADAVHDMRVAARRLRAAIALLGDGNLAELEPEVKALQDALGAVRDLQVQHAWLKDAARRPATRSASALLAWSERGRGKAEKKLQSALRSWNGAVAAELAEAADDAAGRGRLGGDKLARPIRQALATLARRAGRVRGGASPRAAHRLRIAAKKVRYLAELLEPAHRGAVGELLDMLVPVQALLGDLHDADVRSERLEAIAGDGSTPERRAAGALLEVVRQERSRLERKLLVIVEQWHADATIEKLRRMFAK